MILELVVIILKLKSVKLSQKSAGAQKSFNKWSKIRNMTDGVMSADYHLSSVNMLLTDASPLQQPVRNFVSTNTPREHLHHQKHTSITTTMLHNTSIPSKPLSSHWIYFWISVMELWVRTFYKIIYYIRLWQMRTEQSGMPMERKGLKIHISIEL